jgi:tetratricopeptide (TPR) repeat protein
MDNYRAVEEMFTRALQLDNRLPAALNGLADMLSRRSLDFWAAPPDDVPRAEELVSRVLATNPNDALAHFIKGQILRAQRRYDEAMIEYEAHIALYPMAVRARSNLARAKILVGEPAEAIPLLEQAMRISPHDPGIGYMQWRMGFAYLLLGKTDEAIRWTEKSLLTYYDVSAAYLDLAAAFSLNGDEEVAQAALAEAIKRDPKCTIAKVRIDYLSNRPKFVELLDQTLIAGLRKAGLPE